MLKVHFHEASLKNVLNWAEELIRDLVYVYISVIYRYYKKYKDSLVVLGILKPVVAWFITILIL